jgi:hypothetical protein
MQANALFIGWGPVVRGRETKSLQVFGEAIEYWSRLVADGTVESFEAYGLDPHGGDLGGFLIAKGDPQKLANLRLSEEFIRLNARAQTVVENFGVVGASTGSNLEQLFGYFGELAAELA